MKQPIIISITGLKHGARHGFDEAATVPFLEEIIPRAEWTGAYPDDKGRNTIKAIHRLEAPVIFDGAARRLAVVGRVDDVGRFSMITLIS